MCIRDRYMGSELKILYQLLNLPLLESELWKSFQAYETWKDKNQRQGEEDHGHPSHYLILYAHRVFQVLNRTFDDLTTLNPKKYIKAIGILTKLGLNIDYFYRVVNASKKRRSQMLVDFSWVVSMLKTLRIMGWALLPTVVDYDALKHEVRLTIPNRLTLKLFAQLETMESLLSSLQTRAINLEDDRSDLRLSSDNILSNTFYKAESDLDSLRAEYLRVSLLQSGKDIDKGVSKFRDESPADINQNTINFRLSILLDNLHEFLNHPPEFLQKREDLLQGQKVSENFSTCFHFSLESWFEISLKAENIIREHYKKLV
eukprot:TRINITY_DN5100_c0_g1_i8.p1 TRINITY_DN5100_c0_g1~~TRINITY_DN5100_c0_g1_i8.p1  ORF type:complete len:316 (+),score=45.44 TRINITY_DN5100_c0_g1_i8:73-1020(+)